VRRTIVVTTFILFCATLICNAQASLLKGKITDKQTGTPVSVRLNFINSETGESIFESKSNSSSGEYTCVIPLDKNTDIKIVMESDNYPKQEKIFKFKYTGEYQELNFDIMVEKTLLVATQPVPVLETKAKKAKSKKKKK